MTADLKPCPFCGSECRICPAPRDRWQVLCVGCGTLGGYHWTREDAATSWNLRASDAECERLRNACELGLEALEDQNTASEAGNGELLAEAIRALRAALRGKESE